MPHELAKVVHVLPGFAEAFGQADVRVFPCFAWPCGTMPGAATIPVKP